MFDLIKTIIAGIWVERRYRYIIIFLLACSAYRFYNWAVVLFDYEMHPVVFKQINDDGSLQFTFAKKYNQTIYPQNLQLPTRHGVRNENYDVKAVRDSKACEAEFFKIYSSAVMALVRSAVGDKFAIHFEKKFPKNVGEIFYIDKNGVEKNIYQALYSQGMVFDKTKDVNYCEEVMKISGKSLKVKR